MKKVRYCDWTMKYPPWTNLTLKFDGKQLRHYESLHWRFPFLYPYKYDYRYSKTNFNECEISFKIDSITPRSEINKLTKLLKRRKSLTYIGLT